MGARIEVESALAPLTIPGQVLSEMCAHAREALPEECCGLLTGNDQDPYRAFHRCRNDMTRLHTGDPVQFPRDGKSAFYMNETDVLRAQKTAEEGGDRITAIYHSHVGAGAYFSPLDQAYANQPWFPFPDADHIVIGVLDGRVSELAAFQRDAATARFRGRAVLPLQP